MQNRPANWAAIFASPHVTEYRFLINGDEYREKDLQGTPILEKPLMQEPCIGRCCTGSVTLAIRPHANAPIPKAASVIAYCRLKSRDGLTVTDWIEQGHFWISRRSASNDLLMLTCRDGMMLAGRTYLDKTSFITWPVAMIDVFAEIVSLMGVEVDSRTFIKSGKPYMVDYPNDDVLMSEILSMIAAAHGGIFVMSESGKLRLVPYPNTGTPVQAIGTSYMNYRALSTGRKTVSRVTLTDSANNQFTYGDDSGIELATECEYATQEMVRQLSEGYSIEKGVLSTSFGSIDSGVFRLNDGSTLENGTIVLTANSRLIGRSFTPYELTGAYIDPLIEVGDTFSITRKGITIPLIATSLKIRCNPSFVCDAQYGVKDDDEDEVPFVSAAELRAKRYVSIGNSYFGNRITRTEGFVSTLMDNDEPIARMVANANRFSMQRKVGSDWEDCLYFDPVAKTYKFKGEVEISTLKDASVASVTNTSLAFAADANGGAFSRTYESRVFAYTGEKKVTPTVTGVSGAVDGMIVSIGSEIDNQIPISVSVSDGATLGSAESTSGTLIVHVTAPIQIDLEINWCKVNTGIAGTPGKDGVDGAPGKDGADGAPGKDGIDGAPGKDGVDGAPGKDGTDGAPGKDGTDGKDGVSYYTWIKYADSPTSGMSDSPTGKKYIGIAYNKSTSTESNDYADYAWSLIKGADGSSGYSNAVIQLYQRSSTSVTKPTSETTFTFSSNALIGDIGEWSRDIPAGSDPCYTVMAAVSSALDTITVPAESWSSPILFVENGTNGKDGADGAPGKDGADGTNGKDGKDGADGTNGYNTAFVYLYKRSESIPAKPSTSTLFTFATASLTGEMDGWSQSIPTTDGNPCWVVSAQIAARTATATVDVSAWTSPVKLVEDGEGGASTYCQPDPPENGKAMDLWIDSNDNFKLYRHDGSGWVSIQDANIPDIIEQLASAQTSLKVLNESIKASASATYVTNQINSLIETFNSALELQAKELTAQFEGTAQNAAGEVNQKFSTLIRASGDGVEIGKSDSNFRVLLSNDRLSFRQIDGSSVVEVAYMSNRKLYITDAQITNELAFGPNGGNRFVWTKTSKGLSLRYISA